MIKPTLLFLLICGAFAGLSGQSTGAFSWVLPLQSARVPIGIPSSDQFAFRENGHVFWQSPGKQPVLLPYDSVSFAYDGTYWLAWQNGLQGILKPDGREWVPSVYDQAWPLSKAPDCWAFHVTKYGLPGIVTDQNRLIGPWRSNDYLYASIVGDTLIEYRSRGSIAWLSRGGTVVGAAAARLQKPAEFQRVAADQYVLTTVQKDGRIRQDTFREAGRFEEGVAPVRRDSLWGYIRRDGSWLIAPKFQAAQPFDNQGHATVKLNGKYTVVRRNGSLLFPPRFGGIKAFSPVLFEYQEGDRIGLTDTLGKVVLPAGAYQYFTRLGRSLFGVRQADSTLVYRNDGVRIPIDSVKHGDGYYSDNLCSLYLTHPSQSAFTLVGVIDAKGNWLIPPIFAGRMLHRRHFILAEARMRQCCTIPGLDKNFNKNQSERYLAFNRSGQLLLPEALFLQHPVSEDEKYLIFKEGNKFGLLLSSGEKLEAEYDELRSKPYGWVFARKGTQWGVLRVL